MNAMIRIEQHFRQHTLFGVLSAQISLLGSTYLPEMSVGRTTDVVSWVGSLLHTLRGVRVYRWTGEDPLIGWLRAGGAILL